MDSENTIIARSLRPRGPAIIHLISRRLAEATVLEVTGELDLLTAAKLGAQIDRELRGGTGDLVVDLTGTAFVDSAGLHILLNAQRRLIRQGRNLAVVCRPGPVRRVFELARLIETLGVVSSLRDYRSRASRGITE